MQINLKDKKTRRSVVIGALVGLLIIGLADVVVIGGHQHHSSVTTNPIVTPTKPSTSTTATPQHPIVIEKSLPAGAENKLSSFASRLTIVSQLPLSVQAAQNVLYIGPGEGYAIAPFQQVWSHLSHKPTVVWTASQSNSRSTWASAGFKGDPLHSPQTQYITKNLPVPDAYHQISQNKWVEMPGVLRPSEVNKWVGFFSGKYDGIQQKSQSHKKK